MAIAQKVVKPTALPLATVNPTDPLETVITAVKKYASSKAKTATEIAKQHQTRVVIRAWHKANASLVDSLKVKLGDDLSKVYNRIVTLIERKKTAVVTPPATTVVSSITVDTAIEFLKAHGYIMLKNGNLAKAKA